MTNDMDETPKAESGGDAGETSAENAPVTAESSVEVATAGELLGDHADGETTGGEAAPFEAAAADEASPETAVVADIAGAPQAGVPEGTEAAALAADLADPETSAEAEPKKPWTQTRVQACLEALLFASADPLTMRAIHKILPDNEVDAAMITHALDSLRKRYESAHSGIVLSEIAGGWQVQTREEFFPWVQKLAKTRSEERLTQAGLETLAVVAYKQPITRAEVDAVRGVGSGQLIRTLMDRNLVKVVGRVDLPGRPFQYGTTQHFLEHFGLASLADLPKEKDL